MYAELIPIIEAYFIVAWIIEDMSDEFPLSPSTLKVDYLFIWVSDSARDV